MDDARPFGLVPDQVPNFPQGGNAADQLRWCVMVMDHDDKDLGFASSLLSHHSKFGELSEKQWKYGQRTVSRTRTSWENGELKCQSAAAGRPRLVAGKEMAS